ncbi:MAG: FMN-binding protein, partial [Halanaerobium sp.]
RGSAEGHSGEIEVSLLVEDEELQEIRIVSQEESAGIGDEAMAELTESLLADRSLEVDTVSGATNSSEGFLAAVEDALSSERYGSLEDAEDLQTAEEIMEEAESEEDEEEGGSNG